MNNVARSDEARARRRLTNTVKQALRDLRSHLTVLNHRVGGRIELKDTDLDCLELIGRHGPLSPSALARRAGLHPATLTGVIDRLERGGWVQRVRDPDDRRAVVIEPRRERGAEVVRQYAGMNSLLDDICAGYSDADLTLIADFLARTSAAALRAADDLAERP